MFDQLRKVAAVLLAGFLAQTVGLPPLPRLRREALTSVAFRRITETLFSQGSQGAFEQYLVAGALRTELVATGRPVRAECRDEVRESQR